MILSVSRRTDIPAFYSEWFFNRIKEGFLYVKNPINRKQISKIMIKQNVIDCIVFWTKNPKPMLDNLDLLSEYAYYFQYTLNPYGKTIEQNVPFLDESINIFKRLSDKIGPEKVIWRYDPIFITKEFNSIKHIYTFEKIAKSLSKYTDKCVISFLDVYKKCERNMKILMYRTLTDEEILILSSEISKIAMEHGIILETCAEEIDLTSIGIIKGKCIDDELISKISNKNLIIGKDKNQREICGCVASIDIGSYNTCKHNCIYCYANYDLNTVLKNSNEHDNHSALLCGSLLGDEKITERKMVSNFASKGKGCQLELF
jgi:DNA repair photolyase